MGGLSLIQNPEVPPALDHVWEWFWELIPGGDERLSHLEIEAWARLRSVRLRSLEVRALRKLDSVRLEVINERSRQSQP